jgi:hypothetical protein
MTTDDLPEGLFLSDTLSSPYSSVNPRQIALISDEALEGWIYYPRSTLEGHITVLERPRIRVRHQRYTDAQT